MSASIELDILFFGASFLPLVYFSILDLKKSGAHEVWIDAEGLG